MKVRDIPKAVGDANLPSRETWERLAASGIVAIILGIAWLFALTSPQATWPIILAVIALRALWGIWKRDPKDGGEHLTPPAEPKGAEEVFRRHYEEQRSGPKQADP